jgi:serine/threonine protein kinase
MDSILFMTSLLLLLQVWIPQQQQILHLLPMNPLINHNDLIGSHPVLRKYELTEMLGTGAFSQVRVGIEKATGHKYAIKIIDKLKCKGKEDMIQTEVRILSMVRHENIVELYEMYEFEDKIYLVMELVTGGELFDEIMHRGTFSEHDAAQIIQKILEAVLYLHTIGIVHRDLKVTNTNQA